MTAVITRRLPVGAEVMEEGVHFRIWAPGWKTAFVHLAGPDRPRGPACFELEREADGYFSLLVAAAGPGTRYRFSRDNDDALLPDPASRFQPEGPFGPSEAVDPAHFPWTDAAWPGVRIKGQVIYEMHIGTFTREGTWEAAARELPELTALGISLIEVMPLADFSGRFGWGYDGVNLFAPTRLYGRPDDLRRFVDQAHAAGIGVILDVVYNHLGPEGCFLRHFCPDYFARKSTEWGTAINFDGESSGPVRELFIANGRYWIEEFHLDGLRLDATQSIFDASPRHILAELSEAVRRAAGRREVVLIAENEPQDVRVLAPVAEGGYGFDAMWNDDFHHTAMVALTGHREAYYSDYRGSPQEFISAGKWGFLYQGQWYAWQHQRRGTPSLGIAPEHFVTFIQNHDQVANSIRGERYHFLSSPGRFRALTALLLLGPQTPMLFQGQEFCAASPFLYFADLSRENMEKTTKGRLEFLSQFPSLALPGVQPFLPDPAAEETFAASKLDFADRRRNEAVYRLYRDLIGLRRQDPVFRAQSGAVDGAVLGPEAFLLRFFGEEGEDRLLLVNLGSDLHVRPAPEPLLAPPAGCSWEILWSSEDPCYGGSGTPHPETGEIRLKGRAAVVLRPVLLASDRAGFQKQEANAVTPAQAGDQKHVS